MCRPALCACIVRHHVYWESGGGKPLAQCSYYEDTLPGLKILIHSCSSSNNSRYTWCVCIVNCSKDGVAVAKNPRSWTYLYTCVVIGNIIHVRNQTSTSNSDYILVRVDEYMSPFQTWSVKRGVGVSRAIHQGDCIFGILWSSIQV